MIPSGALHSQSTSHHAVLDPLAVVCKNDAGVGDVCHPHDVVPLGTAYLQPEDVGVRTCRTVVALAHPLSGSSQAEENF